MVVGGNSTALLPSKIFREKHFRGILVKKWAFLALFFYAQWKFLEEVDIRNSFKIQKEHEYKDIVLCFFSSSSFSHFFLSFLGKQFFAPFCWQKCQDITVKTNEVFVTRLGADWCPSIFIDLTIKKRIIWKLCNHKG